MVIHHGEAPWSAAKNLSDLLDGDPAVLTALGPYLPSFRFFLEDITVMDDEALRSRSLTAVAALALLLLRNARRSANLLADLRNWGDLLVAVASAPNGLAAFAALLEYTLQVGKVPADGLRQLVHELGPATEEAFVTTYEQIKAEGRAEGMAKGRAEGKAELLLRMLTVRFGSLPAPALERVRDAAPATLDGWAERLVTASSVDDVFR